MVNVPARFGALLNGSGKYVWCCMNHFGGDPIFNCLANNDSAETGFFDISLLPNSASVTQSVPLGAAATTTTIKFKQEYVPLTAVLVTTITQGILIHGVLFKKCCI